MNKKPIFRTLFLFLALIFALPAPANADDAHDLVSSAALSDGTGVFSIADTLYAGDEYISADNRLYRVSSVSGQTALLEDIGDEEMPDVGWLSDDSAKSVFSAADEKRICLYVTHSDESYIPTDGKQSIVERGGIYDVAKSLKADLEQLGVTVYLDTSTHLPHDGGAYRRSRQTAAQLIKHAPDALIDIHRDGIPDPDEYAVTIGGEKMSKVRLLVGRSNQNSAANRAFAKQIKAVADKLYPGLIKDIFIGKGNYNQDLAPHAILLEFGTHTLSKDRVINSTDLMANVLVKTLYGSISGSAGGGTSRENAESADTPRRSDASGGAKTPDASASDGAGSGMLFLLVLAIVLIAVFAFLATGTGKGMRDKIARNTREITGGLFGKKPRGQ